MCVSWSYVPFIFVDNMQSVEYHGDQHFTAKITDKTFVFQHQICKNAWSYTGLLVCKYITKCVTEDYHALHHYYYHRAGTFVSIAAIGLHRQPDIWENPEVKQSISVCWQYAFPKEYDPLRFLPEKCEGRDSYAYMPFSAGPRYHNSKESECFYNLFL